MNDVKTSGGSIVIVAALAAVAAMVFGVGPKIKEALEDDDAVIVVVDFAPNKRSGKAAQGRQFPDLVAIEIFGGENLKDTATRSPWTRVFHPKKTTKFTVVASQVYGTNIGVVVNRGKVEQCSDRKTGAAQVTCTYTFKP